MVTIITIEHFEVNFWSTTSLGTAFNGARKIIIKSSYLLYPYSFTRGATNLFKGSSYAIIKNNMGKTCISINQKKK